MLTGSWFFNYEKDLLCTALYRDLQTGDEYVLGGTEGYGTFGGRMGRIWVPDVYADWAPPSGLLFGNVDSVVNPSTIRVDNSGDDLYLDHGGLAGLWVLVVDENKENAQLGYIDWNDADTFHVSDVIGSAGGGMVFDPLPTATSKFYLCLIECRWGPKFFEFGDPDSDKKVIDVRCVLLDYDDQNLPIVEFHEGITPEVKRTLTLVEDKLHNGTASKGLHVPAGMQLISMPRWGMSIVDRSYGKYVLNSITVSYTKADEK
jgi:hypothetical protein